MSGRQLGVILVNLQRRKEFKNDSRLTILEEFGECQREKKLLGFLIINLIFSMDLSLPKSNQKEW